MFKPGTPKPPNSGIKKGQKHARTSMRERLEELGVDLMNELAGIMQRAKDSGDDVMLHDAIKTALPYCYKKLPTDISVTQAQNTLVILDSVPMKGAHISMPAPIEGQLAN